MKSSTKYKFLYFYSYKENKGGLWNGLTSPVKTGEVYYRGQWDTVKKWNKKLDNNPYYLNLKLADLKPNLEVLCKYYFKK